VSFSNTLILALKCDSFLTSSWW